MQMIETIKKLQLLTHIVVNGICPFVNDSILVTGLRKKGDFI